MKAEHLDVTERELTPEEIILRNPPFTAAMTIAEWYNAHEQIKFQQILTKRKELPQP